MKTIYKGCNISINLLSHKDGLIAYKYYITTHKGNDTLDHEFEGMMDYINDKTSINHLFSKARGWIDEYLSE